jgi:hypothetical protein
MVTRIFPPSFAAKHDRIDEGNESSEIGDVSKPVDLGILWPEAGIQMLIVFQDSCFQMLGCEDKI